MSGSAYQWKVNGVNAGTNTATYSYTPANGDIITCVATTPAGSCVTTGTATSNAVTMAVTPLTTPTASIAASATSVCGSTNVTFTATTNVSGSSYQWKVNGTNAGTNSATYAYAPINGDLVSCVVSMPATGCYTASSVTSSGITMTVSTATTPTVSVSSGATSVCAGSSLTLNATSNVSGVSYQWKVNGINMGTNSSSYTYVPANGDVVSCQTTMPSTGCFTANIATSSGVTLTVSTPVTPTAAITASAATLCAGSNVNLTATTNVTSAGYQWQVNGTNSGTGNTLSYIPANGDVVKCTISAPSGSCYSTSSVVSNIITLSVTPLITPSINISGPASTPIGATVTVTASLTNAPANYTITWYKNSLLLATTTVSTTTYIKAAGADTITAIIATSGACYSNGISNKIYLGDALGVASAGVTPNIQVYPSPFALQLFVRGLLQGDVVTLTETGSKIARVWQIAQPEKVQLLNVDDIASGMYFLKITGRDGMLRSTHRIVRE